MILHGFETHQTITGRTSGMFYKELLVTEGEVPLSMVRKRRLRAKDETKAPILLVHGFGQNRYAFHLPSRSFANHLAREGYDVFNLDLRGHGRSRHLSHHRVGGVDDYYREDLPSAVEEVQRVSGGRPVFIVGHSLGGLVNYAAAPLLKGKLAGICSIGSPYFFAQGSLALRALSLLAKTVRRTGAHSINTSLAIHLVGAAMRQLRVVADRQNFPMPIRGWKVGGLEPLVLDEHFRLAFDYAGFQELSELVGATQFRDGSPETLRFEASTFPLLVIAGTRDDLAPPASVKPAYTRSSSPDRSYREVPLGHIDLLVGHEAPEMTWRIVTEWIGARLPRVHS